MTRRLLAAAATACLAAAGCGTHVAADRVRLADSQPTTRTDTVPSGMQRGWLRGVGVDAPADWAHDDIPCGSPASDTLIVEYAGAGSQACLRPPTRGLSVVWMGTFTRPLPDNALLGEATIPTDASIDGFEDTTVDGVAAKETLQRTDDGRRLQLVLFPDRGVFVSIASPDQALVDAAVSSLQVVTTDPATGCVVHTDEYDAGGLTGQVGSFALLPGDPTSAAACVYVGGWLEQTATLTGDKLVNLMNAIRSAPATTDQRAPDDSNCESVAADRAPSDDPPMLLRFDGPDGSWRLVAKINWCTRWQSTITSGSVTRRIDQRLLLALPPLWTTTPSPDSMDVP